MALTQRTFLHSLGEQAVIWVDPAKVEMTVGSKWPVGKRRVRQLSRYLPSGVVKMLRPWIKRREPFVIPAEAFATPEPIDRTPRYRRIADLLANRDDVSRSAWHRDLMAELRETGCARHKDIAMHSAAEVDEFFVSYVLALVESLEREGYRPEAETEGYASTAIIGPDGEIVKTGSGNHRFCIAKEIGLPRFPLKIVGAHADWVARTLGASPSVEDVLRALPALEAGARLPVLAARRRGAQRQDDPESAALAGGALDPQAAAVAVDDVLDDREPQPGAAHLARAVAVDAIETLGQTRDM